MENGQRLNTTKENTKYNDLGSVNVLQKWRIALSIEELIKILQCCNRPELFRQMESQLQRIEELKLTNERKEGLQNFINTRIF